ncbi:MAG: XdhC family protein [Pelotomaculum sp.]|jgi:xanthine dehydrogenase accessory factor
MAIKLEPGVAIVTVIGQENLSDGIVGQKQIFNPDGTGRTGNIELPWLEAEVANYIKNDLSYGSLKQITVANPDKQVERATVMIDPYLPPYELVILGGGHIAVPLVKIGKILGYQVTVMDDRQNFATPQRFPEADRTICCAFSDIEKHISFGPMSSVVIVTRGPEYDQECLRRLIKYNLAYVGMIGSRRKIKLVRDLLLEDGIPAEKLEQVHMPVGLDIGAQTPGEVAVSIAAEILKERRGGSTHSLKDYNPQRSTGETSDLLTSSDREVLHKTLTMAETPAALATIVNTMGSTPRKAGSRMLVYEDGRMVGTIGGGSGEAEVAMAALGVIDTNVPCLKKVAVTAGTANLEGSSLGGIMEVFIEPAGAFNSALNGGGRI